MQKGRMGFALWLYPLIALWCIVFGAFTPLLLITGFAIIVEKNEWCSKQCLHTVMFYIIWELIDVILGYLEMIPIAGVVFSVIDAIIWIVFVILVFVLGMARVTKGMDIGLPGKGTIDRAYGFIQNMQQRPQQGGQPYGQNMQQRPQQGPQQGGQPYGQNMTYQQRPQGGQPQGYPQGGPSQQPPQGGYTQQPKQ